MSKCPQCDGHATDVHGQIERTYAPIHPRRFGAGEKTDIIVRVEPCRFVACDACEWAEVSK